ncbi:MAG: dCTP deaminase domain-containing protein, partial [Bacteroidia bacterium]
MILSDKRILEEIEKKTIVIEPYDRAALGSNSYDVHLGPHLA